jgi:hypothetical protein
MIVGGASGKRTLTDVMDEDLAAKRKKIDGTPPRISRFFGSPSKTTSQCEDLQPEEVSDACAHCAVKENVKENVPPLSDDDVDLDMDKAESENNFVMQEDGYVSPSSPYDRDDSTSELSSPDKPVRAVEDDDFEVDAISSPPITRSHRKAGGSGAMLFLGTRRPGPDRQGQADEVVDLRDVFMDDSTSDIDVFEDEQGARGIGSLETVSPSPSPQTPVDEDGDLELELELTDIEAEASVARTDIVATGWWMKYAANGKKPLMVGLF